MVRGVDTSDIDWSRFRYMVFDMPIEGHTYQERFTRIGTIIYVHIYLFNSSSPPPRNSVANHFQQNPCKYIEIAKWEECRNEHHFEQTFQNIIDQGGEGIILRDPSSPYQPGRSPGYLKHKACL